MMLLLFWLWRELGEFGDEKKLYEFVRNINYGYEIKNIVYSGKIKKWLSVCNCVLWSMDVMCSKNFV